MSSKLLSWRSLCLGSTSRSLLILLSLVTAPGIFAAPSPLAAPSPRTPILNWQPRSDWVNVKRDVTPQAVGDGIADDTAAIQGAFNQLRDGSSVYFPPGTYRVTRSLTITGPLTGLTIVGHGRSTRLVWDGAAGGNVIEVNGVAYSRFMGLTLDGRGIAAVGLYHKSDRRFETEVRHQDMAFLHFTDAGLLVDPARKLALAETMFENCLFEDCRRGAAFLQFNDYDFTFDGCEFRKCETGVECAHGNFYIRTCHFQESRLVDIQAGPEHGSSIRRCTSLNSNAFIHYAQPVAPLTIEDCWVSGWRSTDGAITLSGAPVMMFDCVFTHPPSAAAPVQVLRARQRLIMSSNRVEGAPYLVKPRADLQLYSVPTGRRAGSLRSASQSFLQEHRKTPGRVFDAKTDFGARGDAKTDDTAAIQRAINAARAWGRGAIAYLPTGSYIITHTLNIGSPSPKTLQAGIPGTSYNHSSAKVVSSPQPSPRYFVGGSGFSTRLVWRGAPGGTMIAVQDSRDVALQSMSVGSADSGTMDNGIDILQTGSSQRSMVTYDGVYVFGMYQKQPFRKGLVFRSLGAGDVVLLPYVQGNLRFLDSARATILSPCSYEGSIVVEGKTGPRDGFLGFETRLTTGCLHPLYLRDSQSIVMSDSYVEQADSGYLLEGSAGDPPGRATIQGAKIEFSVPKDSPDGGVSLETRGYHGQGFVGPDQFYGSPPVSQIRLDGPTDLFLVGCSFYGTRLDVRSTNAARLFLLGDEAIVGTSIPPGPRVPPDDSLRSLSQLVPLFDDFRRLGALDLRLNHPG